MNSLESIPKGFGFDKDAVWQKMEWRLKQKRNRRTATYYAAAVLFLLFLGAYWATTTDQVIPVPAPNKKEIHGQQTTILRTEPRAPETKNPTAITIATRKKEAVREKEELSFITPEDTGVVSTPDQGIKNIIAIIEPVDSFQKKEEVKRPAPRKYPVAHINELYKIPVAESLPYAQKHSIAFRKLEEPETVFNAEESDTLIRKQKTVFSFLISQKQ